MYDNFDDVKEDEDPGVPTCEMFSFAEDTQQPSSSHKMTKIIRTRTISMGSLPELSTDVSEDPVDSLLIQTPDTLRHSAPHICGEEETLAIPVSEPIALQTHHSTAPDLQTLGENGAMANGSSRLHSPHMKISFSDDGLKQYCVIGPEITNSASGPNRSPFSKLRSGLSQVSQLIVNQNSSPHTRRRKQILEAQLLDNSMKSNLRFKNFQTKILIL